ncbi:MAG: hypothetical protein ACP5XB_06140 [Isosphaeraceae bacterium]
MTYARFRTRLLCACWLLPLFLPTSVPALADSDLDHRFRAEYREAAGKLRRAAERFTCEGTFEIKEIGKFKGRLQHRALAASDGSQLSVEAYKLMGGNPVDATVVYCLTKNYFFQLERDSHDAPYALKNLVKDPTAIDSTMRFAHFDLIAKGAFALGGVPFTEILDQPSFSVTGVTDVSERHDATRVEVGFKCSDSQVWILGGTIRLAPSLDWALIDYDVEVSTNRGMSKGMERGSRLRGSVDCVRWPSGHVFPRSGQFRFVRPTEPYGPEPLKYFSLEEVQFLDVPQSQFKLSAFGLPDSALEPPQVGGRGYRTWSIAGIGLLLLGLAGGLRLILRRLGGRGSRPRRPGEP